MTESELLAIFNRAGKDKGEKPKAVIPKRALPERAIEPTEEQVKRAMGMEIDAVWGLVRVHKKLFPHQKGEGRPTSNRARFRMEVSRMLTRTDKEDRTKIIGPSEKQREKFIASMLAQVEMHGTFKPEES